MKSKRKHVGHLNKKLHEELKDLLFHAKPNEAPWYDSGELSALLKKTFKIEIIGHKLGMYLTAARFVKKDFYESRTKGMCEASARLYDDTDYPDRKINKWRVGIYGIDAPPLEGDIEETMGITWDEVRDEDKFMYKVILGCEGN